MNDAKKLLKRCQGSLKLFAEIFFFDVEKEQINSAGILTYACKE